MNDSYPQKTGLQKRRSWRRRLFGLATFGLVLGLVSFYRLPATQAQAPEGPQHQATASWSAATGATGYNVYRCPGTCTATNGTFTVLNAAPITATSFIDANVVNGSTYSWCATSLATLSTGPFESACSTIATATIPKDPAAAPAGFVVTVQ